MLMCQLLQCVASLAVASGRGGGSVGGGSKGGSGRGNGNVFIITSQRRLLCGTPVSKPVQTETLITADEINQVIRSDYIRISIKLEFKMAYARELSDWGKAKLQSEGSIDAAAGDSAADDGVSPADAGDSPSAVAGVWTRASRSMAL